MKNDLEIEFLESFITAQGLLNDSGVRKLLKEREPEMTAGEAASVVAICSHITAEASHGCEIDVFRGLVEGFVDQSRNPEKVDAKLGASR